MQAKMLIKDFVLVHFACACWGFSLNVDHFKRCPDRPIILSIPQESNELINVLATHCPYE